jgi:hypothetical protein
MFKFKNLFKTKECDHTHNFRSLKYKLKDGTPMYEFECYDCGYKDKAVSMPMVRHGTINWLSKETVCKLIKYHG